MAGIDELYYMQARYIIDASPYYSDSKWLDIEG